MTDLDNLKARHDALDAEVARKTDERDRARAALDAARGVLAVDESAPRRRNRRLMMAAGATLVAAGVAVATVFVASHVQGGNHDRQVEIEKPVPPQSYDGPQAQVAA